MTENRQFHKFIIITIIVPSAHDSVIRRKDALGAPVRSPSSPSCCPADLHVLNGFVTVRASCSTPNSSQAWTSASKSDRWLRWRLFPKRKGSKPLRISHPILFADILRARVGNGSQPRVGSAERAEAQEGLYILGLRKDGSHPCCLLKPFLPASNENFFQCGSVKATIKLTALLGAGTGSLQ